MPDGIWDQPLGFYVVGIPMMAVLAFLWLVLITIAVAGCGLVLSLWVEFIHGAWKKFRS